MSMRTANKVLTGAVDDEAGNERRWSTGEDDDHTDWGYEHKQDDEQKR